MHPKNLSITDFTYLLPEDRIAKYPLAERDASKLLIYKKGNITEDIYRNIAGHLPENSLLVFNNTKVIEARLLFQKPTGGVIEVFCLEPHEQYPDITTAMLQQEKVHWQCLVGGASKWKRGQVLEKRITHKEKEIILRATYIEKRADHFIIELTWSPAALSFAELLHVAGAIPLPPYIKRSAETSDAERYQTVYAKQDGSVAAPTAGLHFTDVVFSELDKKNIDKTFVTLHVGAGTFKPVKSEIMEQHEMHAEFIEVSKDTIEAIRNHLQEPLIAVGTTSLRTIESLYWLGVKLSMGNSECLPAGQAGAIENTDSQICLSQWEPYDLAEKNIPVDTALASLLSWMEKNKLEKVVAKTQIIIAPGYKLKIVKALITNFHQPQSTLLLLIAALIGNDWKKVYAFALQNDFRFLSYGDGNLLWVNED